MAPCLNCCPSGPSGSHSNPRRMSLWVRWIGHARAGVVELIRRQAEGYREDYLSAR